MLTSSALGSGSLGGMMCGCVGEKREGTCDGIKRVVIVEA